MTAQSSPLRISTAWCTWSLDLTRHHGTDHASIAKESTDGKIIFSSRAHNNVEGADLSDNGHFKMPTRKNAAVTRLSRPRQRLSVMPFSVPV